MRKQNDSIPTVLKADSRLINAVIRRRKCKRPNAQKHGLFARPLIIPGEDPREFDQILGELRAEWKPAGPTLRDALADLAETKFRKRRLKNYVQTELHLHTFNPHHPAFDEGWGFAMFMHYLGVEPETCFDKHAKKCLRPDKIDDLEQKFPRADYQSTAEWANAITTEILSILLPAKPRFEAPELAHRADALEQAVREWRTDQQVAGSITYARELLEYELKETERLNAMIVKQTRHCAELKAWEEAEKARSKT
jgi:hypothetical protein